MLDESQRQQLAHLIASIGESEPASRPSPQAPKWEAAREVSQSKKLKAVDVFFQKWASIDDARAQTVSGKAFTNAEAVVSCLSNGPDSLVTGAHPALELGSPRTIRVLYQSFKNLREVQNALQRAYIDDPDPSQTTIRRLQHFMRAVVKFEELLAAAESPARGRSDKKHRSVSTRSGRERIRSMIARLGSQPRLVELAQAVSDYERDFRALDQAPASIRGDLAESIANNLSLISHLVSQAWRSEPDVNEQKALEELHSILSLQLKSASFEASTVSPQERPLAVSEKQS